MSDIVIWELAMLMRSGRIDFSFRDPRVSRLLREVTVLPITPEVATAIGSLDFESDPADEIIAATSIVHHLPLVTRDMRILGSKVVPLAVR